MDREEEMKVLVQSLIRISKLHRKVVDKKLHKTGVFESQHRLLMHLSRNKDSSQIQLAESLHVSAATIAVTLKKLEKGGYVERNMNTSDNRFNKIDITKKGQKVVEDSKEIFKGLDLKMFEDFSDEDIGDLMQYLEKLIYNLKKCDIEES